MNAAQLLLETLRLRHGLEAHDLRKAWTEVETHGLGRLVGFEGCALWLYRRFQQLGVETDVPGARPFHAWVARQARRATAQNLMIANHTPAVLAVLEQVSVPFVLLKGVARLTAASLYPHADAHVTHDVDLLVPYKDAQRAWEGLREAGYAAHEKSPNGHGPGTLVNDEGVSVELHTSTSPEVEPDEAWNRIAPTAEPLDCGGVPAPVPSATELLWHGVINGTNQAEHAFRLRFFLDAASVVASERPVDWPVIRSRLDSFESGDPDRAVAWLGACGWLAGAPLAAEVARGVRPFNLVRSMRWRFAVSRRFDPAQRWGRQLFEEGTRVEAGMPLASAVPQTPPLVQVHRRATTAAARGAYLAWRATRT